MRFALVISTVLAGCASAPSAPESWMFGGSWTQDYTQSDLDAWCAIAKQYGDACEIMTSYPPQYALHFSSEATCDQARAKVLALPHILARDCTKIVPATDPNAPTSSSPQGVA